MGNKKDSEKSKKKEEKIPIEESDSDDDQNRIVSKKKSKKQESDSEEDMIEPDSVKKKKPSSKSSKKEKEKGISNLDAFILKKIKEFKEIESNKDFDVPEEVIPGKMEERYNWLWDQIDTGGIPCKPSKKEVEHVRFYILGVCKSLKLHLFYPQRPNEEYSTPTEVLRAIYADYDIPTKSIKGWEQTYAFVKRKKSSPPTWLIFSQVIPTDYRNRKGRAAPKKSTKNESDIDDKVTKKKRPSVESDDEKPIKKSKKTRLEKIVDYSHNVKPMIQIPKQVAEDSADMNLRFNLVLGALGCDVTIVKSLVKKMNSALESAEKEKQDESKEASEDDDKSKIDQDDKDTNTEISKESSPSKSKDEDEDKEEKEEKVEKEDNEHKEDKEENSMLEETNTEETNEDETVVESNDVI